MKKIFYLIIVMLILVQVSLNGQTSIQGDRPVYAGKVEYTQGNFGGYNYPKLGDSVFVYLKDSANISLKVFSSNDKEMSPRELHIIYANMQLVMKKRYIDIVGWDDIRPTENFNIKFSDQGNKGSKITTIYITHYSDGTVAELVVLVERDGLAVRDLLVAKIKRLD